MAWYGNRAPGVGQAFYRTFVDVLSTIVESPRMYGLVQGEVRRVVFRKFPYALFYILDESGDEPEIIVLSCLHERRSPERWPNG